MSEMVLRMPSNYVDMDREEMEYVEGGNPLIYGLGEWTWKNVIVPKIIEKGMDAAWWLYKSMVAGLKVNTLPSETEFQRVIVKGRFVEMPY